VLPRPGYPLDSLRARLRALTTTIYNHNSAMEHAAWALAAEASLRECFVDVPTERLFTERFWRLTTGPVQREQEMLRAEQAVQLEWLERVGDAVAAMAQRFGTPRSTLAVPDTHVLLHANPLGDIDWPNMLDVQSVTLVVPLRVVDELDEKKYARRDDLRRNARARLRLLEGYLEGGKVRPGVSIDIISWRDLDVAGGFRPALPVDVDVLDTCEALRVYAADNAVTLVTTDSAMKIRARERELPVTRLEQDLDGEVAQPEQPTS
jgi:rRNA-processing protein FCF1